MNLSRLKDAARSSWPTLLSDLGGISLSILDGNHHPCPKCGGTDRFRLLDQEAGALFCNQCFSSKNGDGIAALQWLRDIPFEEAIRLLAERLGLSQEESSNSSISSSTRRRKNDPAHDLDFYGFNEPLVFSWCRHKPGVTPESVQANGGKAARWKGLFTVIALPILGLKVNSPPRGWLMYNSTGEPLPKSRRDSAPSKILATKGSKAGWVGEWGLRHLSTAELVWKVEGASDLLALFAAIPPDLRATHLVLSNSFGAAEKPQSELLEVLRGKAVNVLGDTDAVGRASAVQWWRAIAGVAISSLMVFPPGEYKDVRDWLNAGHTYADLLTLARDAAIQPPDPILIDSSKSTENSPLKNDLGPMGFGQEGNGTGCGAIGGGLGGVIGDILGVGDEADDDPSRLAYAFLRYKLNLLRSYQEEIYYHESGQWRKKSDDVVRSDVTCFLRKEFHRLNLEEKAASALKEGAPPKVRKIVNSLTSSVLSNLHAYSCVPSDCPWGIEITFPPTDEVGLSLPGEKQHWISVENGILRLEAYLDGLPLADMLHPHSPTWWSPHKLPYAFDPAANASSRPRWEAFLARNLEGDQERIATLQEWAGYCLTPDTSMQRFMIVEGDGANGKSVYCAVLEALLGPNNVSHVPLELWAERFSLSSTIGRLANIASEVGELDKVAEGFLKSFVSGDRMTFDRKGREPVEIIPTARLLIATNNFPRFSDRSKGIWRRMLLVPFNVEIPEADRVPGMDKYDWWLRSGEMPAILNWALEGLARLIQRGRFHECAAFKQAIEDHRTQVDPAREFLLVTYERSRDALVKKEEVYDDYRSWCKKNGYERPLASTSFGQEVHRVFHDVGETRPGGIERKMYYTGIRRVEPRQFA